MLFRRRAKNSVPFCKPDGHTVYREDLDDLLANPKFPIETVCEKCDKDLRISSDEDDPKNSYWVTEL